MLELNGYLVLKALDGGDAVQAHSKQIHVLLADVSVNGATLAETLKPYRPRMRFLLVTSDLETTLPEVRQLLKLPKQEAVGSPVDRKAPLVST